MSFLILVVIPNSEDLIFGMLVLGLSAESLITDVKASGLVLYAMVSILVFTATPGKRHVA